MPSSTSSSERRRGQWPAGLLAGLALFLAAEHLLWSRPGLLEWAARYTPPGADGDPLRSAAQLRNLEPGNGVPILLLGSSQVREGLDCRLFEQQLPGRTCTNLAIGAGSPLDMLYVQRRYAARVPKRVVVLGLFPKLMHLAPKDAFVDGSTLSSLLTSDAWWRIGGRGWSDVTFGLLQGLSPSLRYKDALWAAREVIDGRWADARALRLLPQPERAGTRQQPPSYFNSHLGRLDGDFPQVGPYTGAQERALERLLRAERGQLVFVVDFPTRPGYETTLPEPARRHYAALLEHLAARQDIEFVPRERLPQLGAEDFNDFTHLSEGGRARVSERLAQLVAEAELIRQ